MLIVCVECKLQVSDKAYICPHCGYPLKKGASKQKYNKRKKLPNGFGQISEIKKNLRKPYRAMVTIGTKPNGRPDCKVLGYFETYNDAYAALVEYNKNPFDFKEDITMNELFDKWFQEYKEEGLHPTTYSTALLCWKYCSQIYDVPVRDIKVRHIKQCVYESSILKDGIKKEPSIQQRCRIKSTLNRLFDYAVNNELISTNPARSLTISKNIRNSVNDNKHHEALSIVELHELWEMDRNECQDIMLIQCYTGFRPQEICSISVENIDFEALTITGGMKTDAGKNRVVPIHKAIEPILKRYAKRKGSEVFAVSYNQLNSEYKKFHGHKPHDGRKTFITLAKKYNMDEYAIKYIVGHSISDLTERVYTDREFEWLRKEISKIPGEVESRV